MLKLLEKENDLGNVEYKSLINRNKNRKENLLTQFFFRLREGYGISKYIIGIDNDGYLLFKELKDILKSVLYFYNITKDLAECEIKIYKYRGYIFSVLCYKNKKYENINNLEYILNL